MQKIAKLDDSDYLLKVVEWYPALTLMITIT